jgi:DNA-binding response OmpR family regulator
MPKDQSRSVISIGTLVELVSLREAVLKSVGYEVFSTTRAQDAVSRIREGYCGVLLLCYSVPEEWRKELIQEFREKCPEGRIVAITDRRIAEIPRQVDELIFGLEGAEALINAIRGSKA